MGTRVTCRIAIDTKTVVRTSLERSVDELRGCVQHLSGDARLPRMRATHHILDRLPRREYDPPNLPVGRRPRRPRLQQCRANNNQPRCPRNKIGVTGELVARAKYLVNVGDCERSFDVSTALTATPQKAPALKVPHTHKTAGARPNAHCVNRRNTNE